MQKQIEKTNEYKTFDDWFCENEGYSLRAERFYDSLSAFHSDSTKAINAVKWLQAAFDAGYHAGINSKSAQ